MGTPLDIVTGIHAGVDMFDCVLPTRNARNGTLYTSLGKINIKRREFAEDDGPLDPNCRCYACRNFSRAYLRHLYASQELASFRLNLLHNLTYYLDLARNARQAIVEGRFMDFLARSRPCIQRSRLAQPQACRRACRRLHLRRPYLCRPYLCRGGKLVFLPLFF